MKTLIISDDKRFSRMLSLEIMSFGVDVKLFDAPCGEVYRHIPTTDITMIDARAYPRFDESAELEKTQVMIFGYAEELAGIADSLPSGFRVLTRPFFIPDFLYSIFEKNDETLVGVKAVKRRKSAADSLVLSEKYKTVSYKKDAVNLTATEFALLLLLIENKGEVVSREDIADTVWGEEHKKDTNIVDVYIRFLREKLDERFGLKIISTVRGKGYMIKTE